MNTVLRPPKWPILLMTGFIMLPASAESYRLATGRHATYQARVTETRNAVRTSRHDRYDLYVLAEREDNRNDLLITARANLRSAPAGASGALMAVDRYGDRSIPSVVITHLDPLQPALDVLPYLPKPLDEESWTSPPDRYGRRLKCRRIGPDERLDGAVQIRFEVVDPTGVMPTLKRRSHGAYWFDPRRGLVVRLEKFSADDQTGTERQTIAVLTSTRSLPASWTRLQRTTAERYLRTLRLEESLRRTLHSDPTRLRYALDRLKRYWEEFLGAVPRSDPAPFLLIAKRRFAELEETGEMWRRQAAYIAQRVGRPAPSWSLQTPAGETVASSELAGITRLEYRWEAANPAALRGFRALRLTRADVPEAELAIVCLNTDQDMPAAVQAIAVAGRGLVQLLLGPVATEPAPPGPIVQLIDREGRVRHITFGWRPSWAYLVENEDADE